MGKEIGSSKGKGGSMHIFSPENNFWGGHGIVGAPAPLGTGIAFANKYKNNNNISIAMYGDGACDQGQVFESYNMAALWNLPVLFIIENNFYSMGTACSRHSSLKANFHLAARPFGIETAVVNGMDFEECYNAILKHSEYVRKNSKPFVLQFDCYRFRGHSMSDAGNTYREKDEIERYKQMDPILNFKEKFLKNKLQMQDEEIEQIEDEISERMNKAFKVSVDARPTSAEELYTDIF
jgi:pyruvate dehydrogenase E1 component alpha subunit